MNRLFPRLIPVERLLEFSRARPRRWHGSCRALLAASLLVAVPPTAGASASGNPAPIEALQHSHWIAEGSAQPRHVLYVFVDANCPFCHKLWQALQPYYRQGLQVRALLVGIIAPSSAGKAAAILEAHDSSSALRQSEQQWGRRADGGGGISPLAHPHRRDLQVLDHDLALMQGFGFPGTPAVVYLDASGKVHAIDGSPDPDRLATIVGAAAVPAR